MKQWKPVSLGWGGYPEQPVCYLRTGGWIGLLSRPPHLHSTSSSIRGDFLPPLPGKSYISSPLRSEAIKTSLLMLSFAHSSAFHSFIVDKPREVFPHSTHGGGGDRLARTGSRGEEKGPWMGEKKKASAPNWREVTRSTSAELYLCIMKSLPVFSTFTEWTLTQQGLRWSRHHAVSPCLVVAISFISLCIHTPWAPCARSCLPATCLHSFEAGGGGGGGHAARSQGTFQN